MLGEPLARSSHHSRFDAREEPPSAASALSSLKRSLASNLNEREKFRNKEAQTREQLDSAEKSLNKAQTALLRERKEAAALRSQLEDQGIQQQRLHEKFQNHSTVGACLESTVSRLGVDVKEGDKLYQEMAAWFKDESEARQELIASAKTLTVRLQSMDTSLAAAEQNVSDLQKVREVLECKLADIQRVQVANLASHAADLEKFEHKVQEALAAKDEVYRDLVSAQQVQGELKETLGLERVAAESLKNDLTALRVEHGKGQDQLQELTNEHTKLLGTHEEMCAHVKDLEESCSALQAETSGLKSVQLELESESAKAKQDHQEQVLAISTELKQSEEAQATLIANLEEAHDNRMKLVQEKDAAAADCEVAASKSQNATSALQAEISELQERIEVLQKDVNDLSQQKSFVTDEKLASEGQLQETLQQVAALEAQLETSNGALTGVEVSLAVHQMTKNVADADFQSEISKLNAQLEDRAQELAKAQASMQTMSGDVKQQGVKRSELETRVSALNDQITQERASNKVALEEQRRCMKADNNKALSDVENQAANHVKAIQQSTVKLQAEVAEKSIEVSKLQSELAELQKSLTQSREEIVAAKEDHSASIARLEATHASSMSSKDDSASKVKNLLDETEAEKEEKMAELNRVQQALTAAENKLKEEQKNHKDKLSALEGELDQEQDENEQLRAHVAELEESVDLSKCEKKSVEAELEKRNILLRKFQGNQVKGSEMTPLATPRSKTQHGSVPHAMKKNTPALPGSSSKKRKRHGGGGNDSSSQDGKRNKKKNGAPQNKPPVSKPPTAPHKKADGSSVQMQRRGRLARMSNSAAASQERSHGAQANNRSQAALTSTEIFGGLLLGNL